MFHLTLLSKFHAIKTNMCVGCKKIRIDSAGDRKYTQFDAVPHPPMKPMAYVQGGLSSLMMM